ncbi:MAG: cysteine synthase family protein [Coriobacteriales bacterium]|nr:cysteine synthase family protein [Coriobacteriales bacterium]
MAGTPRVYNHITELIGQTPLLRLGQLGLPEQVALWAKLECFNPGGSVKDRTAVAMIEAAERSGQLKPGATIVEGTAGNMGLGIATAALGRGYRIIFVVPTKFSAEKQTLMRALGAEVINTPRADGMLGACRKAEELLAEIPGSLSLKQFENHHNPLAHYLTTAPEIYEALEGQVDHFVAGAGSGGTYSGIARYLKERDLRIHCVLADPVGSLLGGGCDHCDYDIEGIGNDFVPATMDVSLVDTVIKVADEDAWATVRLLARAEGLIVGTSSGAAVWAALELARSLEETSETVNIVTVLPDRGDRYFSKNLYEAGDGI